MKASFFFFLILFAISSAFAQNGIELQFLTAPTYSNSVMTGGDPEFRQTLSDFHKPRVRYDIGFLITAVKQSRMAIETGLIYSRKGVSYGEIVFRDVNNEPMGTGKMNLIADYLEIPFRFNYALSDHHINYLIAGVSADVLVHQKFKTRTEGEIPYEPNEDGPDIRKLNAGLQLGYGHRFFRTETFSVDVEPNLKVQLLHAYASSSSVTIRFYTVGVTTKVRFKF